MPANDNIQGHHLAEELGRACSAQSSFSVAILLGKRTAALKVRNRSRAQHGAQRHRSKVRPFRRASQGSANACHVQVLRKAWTSQAQPAFEGIASGRRAAGAASRSGPRALPALRPASRSRAPPVTTQTGRRLAIALTSATFTLKAAELPSSAASYVASPTDIILASSETGSY